MDFNEETENEIVDAFIEGDSPQDIVENWEWEQPVLESDIAAVLEKRKKDIHAELKKRAKEKRRDKLIGGMITKGRTSTEISATLKMSVEDVETWKGKHNAVVDTAKTMAVDSLKLKYPVFAYERLGLLGELLGKIHAEVTVRSLKDVETAELLKLFGQFLKLARDEEPAFLITDN